MKLSQFDMTAISKLPLPSHGQKIDGIKALREFDAYFLAQILKGTQDPDEKHLLDGGSAGRMYRDQFYQQVAQVLAKKGGFGVTEQLKDAFPESASADRDGTREENQ